MVATLKQQAIHQLVRLERLLRPISPPALITLYFIGEVIAPVGYVPVGVTGDGCMHKVETNSCSEGCVNI